MRGIFLVPEHKNPLKRSVSEDFYHSHGYLCLQLNICYNVSLHPKEYI